MTGVQTCALPIWVAGVVLSVQSHTIVSGSQEDATLRYIPAHTLVHNSLQWFLLVDIRILQFRFRLVFRLLETGWHIIFREENLWLAPIVSVLRNLHQGSRWGYMLLGRIAQEMHVELAVPIRHHRLMVIGPASTICLGRMLAVGTERLDIVNSYHWRQSSIMTRRICHRGSGIVDAVLLQQSLHDAFRSTEDGAVLVVLRHTHLLAHIGEMNEILGKMSAEIEEAVTVVINEITIAQRTILRQFDGGWSFHEIAGERLRSLAPRSHRVLGKSHLDIAGIAGIILQNHHIIVLTTIQDRGIYEGVYIFAANNHRQGHMTDKDYHTYMELFGLMTDIVHYPDLMIYLKASIPHLVRNIQKRGRECEQSMALEYLKGVNDLYDQFITQEYKGRVLTIEVDGMDYEHSEQDFMQITNKIDELLYGLFPLEHQMP